MAIYHDVALTLGSTGQSIDVWDGFDFTIDMLHPGQAWTFHFWHSETRQSTWNTLLSSIKLHDYMQLTIDGAVQLSGRIVGREIAPSEGSEVGMIVTGKSLAAIAADFDVEPTITLNNTTLDQALNAILGPLQVPITIGVDVNTTREVQQGRRRSPWASTGSHRRQVVDNFHPHPGEKRWACADRLCRKYGYLLWEAPDPGGGLSVHVDVPITSGQPVYQFRRTLDSNGRTTQDSNIEHGHHRISLDGIPTQVSMCSSAPRGDGLPARYLALLTNPNVFDPRVNVPVVPQLVYRVTEHSRTQAGATQEGRRIIADGQAKFEWYTATVQGAAQTVNGQSTIYAVNTAAHVKDDYAGIDIDTLITAFSCHGSREGGVLSTLHMVPLGAITMTPDPGA